MRKILLLLLFVPAISFAQEDDGGILPIENPFSHYRWEIGINGGVNITDVSGLADSLTTVSRFGKLYGATIIYHFTKNIAFKTDIDFENKGWTINDVTLADPSGSGTTVQDVNQYVDYFDIPAFLHIGFGNRLKFDLNFGPYFAFLLENRTFYNDASGAEVLLTDAAFNNFSSTDFGLTYGGGIDLALGKRWSFGFDLLYEHGLKEITEDGLKNTSLDFDFGINYMFGERKK